MKKLISCLAFIAVGGIGFVCGEKYFMHSCKQYLNSDECRKLMSERFDKLYDEIIQTKEES